MRHFLERLKTTPKTAAPPFSSQEERDAAYQRLGPAAQAAFAVLQEMDDALKRGEPVLEDTVGDSPVNRLLGSIWAASPKEWETVQRFAAQTDTLWHEDAAALLSLRHPRAPKGKRDKRSIVKTKATVEASHGPAPRIGRDEEHSTIAA